MEVSEGRVLGLFSVKADTFRSLEMELARKYLLALCLSGDKSETNFEKGVFFSTYSGSLAVYLVESSLVGILIILGNKSNVSILSVSTKLSDYGFLVVMIFLGVLSIDTYLIFENKSGVWL